MSVNFPHFPNNGTEPTLLSIKQHQGTRRNGISQGDLSLLKLSSNTIPCYLHYHMRSSQVEADATGFPQIIDSPFKQQDGECRSAAKKAAFQSL